MGRLRFCARCYADHCVREEYYEFVRELAEHHSRRRYGRALNLIDERRAAIAPKDPTGQISIEIGQWRAKTLSHLKRYDDAVAEFQSLIAAPTITQAKVLFIRLEIAWVLSDIDRKEEAIAVLEEAVAVLETTSNGTFDFDCAGNLMLVLSELGKIAKKQGVTLEDSRVVPHLRKLVTQWEFPYSFEDLIERQTVTQVIFRICRDLKDAMACYPIIGYWPYLIRRDGGDPEEFIASAEQYIRSVRIGKFRHSAVRELQVFRRNQQKRLMGRK